MNGKSFLVDLTKCTACRGCQIACKQWKKLPAEQTENTGSHQNPPDFSFKTLRVVRFKEMPREDGGVAWLFTPDQCRHCVEPPCKGASEYPESIIHDPETGAVVYTEQTVKEDIEIIRGACPYDVPRVDESTGVINKCDMCFDRVKAGMLPACVKSCPTGTMNFGDREDMLELAEKRLAEAQTKYPEAQLVNAEDVRVIFLTAYDPAEYHEFLSAEAAPRRGMTRKSLLAGLLKPAKHMMRG